MQDIYSVLIRITIGIGGFLETHGTDLRPEATKSDVLYSNTVCASYNDRMKASDHIYIHVPFCSGKCAYCAFYSELFTPELCDRYLDGLNTELDCRFASDHKPEPETIYIGGGTPSVLDPERLERLMGIILAHVSIRNVREWTVEANPGTLSDEKLRLLMSSGVNRISLGAQSFDDDVLRRIGRRHNAADIIETVDLLRRNGVMNVNLDMIACLPGVDEQIWRASMEQAISLEPEHISVYGLMLESGSEFARQVAEGKLKKSSDDLVLSVLKMASVQLDRAGYSRYEISNYSRIGFECAHNVSCWRGEDYIGFGPAASSRSVCCRWSNECDLNGYCEELTSGILPPRSEESLNKETDLTERLIFAFRLAEGVNLAKFRSVSSGINEKRIEILERLMQEGLVLLNKDRWCLTEKGKTFADTVAEDLIL